ncbi:MAG: ABC transporter ATP-binding protein [Armatimonadota bacterium]|nr:ABC transporter ATP-binding protein [Armatimonadota bacterium]MDR5704049.1 ABC transporter ATP-binding protein [Armatimonadota bacterium]
MLFIEHLEAGYGEVKVLHGISLEVHEGECVALVGANGAGKSTLLRAISGMVQIISGRIQFDGVDITRLPPFQIAALGIAHVPEGRRLFPELTVEENLLLGAWVEEARRVRDESLEKVYTLFPRLKERRRQLAGTLSGGEQQMLAIGRGLMLRPRLLMLDEPSLGLSPLLVEQVFDALREISFQKVSLLLAEQNIVQALGLATRAYVIETGRIVMAGPGQELLQSPGLREAYLGL